MSSVADVRGAIFDTYKQGVQEVDDGVLRVEKRHAGKTYAVAFVDLSDHVIERAKSLTTFQERILGQDFFAGDSDLRWNSYLYFWAGPNSTLSADFGSAKSAIESDRHFARKFVLDDKDLLLRLQGKERESANQRPPVLADVGEVWASQLRAASLGLVLEQQPRTTTLDLIVGGTGFRAEPSSQPSAVSVRRDALASGFLRKLELSSFRRVHQGRSFDFTDVNLIVGPNGTGKTSLLEAIEVLYCGRVRRDPEAGFDKIVGTVEGVDGKKETIRATANVTTLKARNMAWYGRTDNQSSAISQGFTRFNFLDTDAAFRLASDASREQIKLDLSRLLVGPETSKLWTHLSKLSDEAAARLRTVLDRLPGERRQVELMTAEVKRLKDAPSEAMVFVQTYRVRLQELKPTWSPTEGEDLLSAAARSRLESLQKWLSTAIAVGDATPVSKAGLELRHRQLKALAERAQLFVNDEEQHLADAQSTARELEIARKAVEALENWSALLAADVPEKAALAAQLEASTSMGRAVLASVRHLLPAEIPAEYREVPFAEALRLARVKLATAAEHEREANFALTQHLRLGESLASLRADLHAASATYIKQSGDDSQCPVCGTAHVPGELLTKLERLLNQQDSTALSSLRITLQFAREQVASARADEEALSTIVNLAESLQPAPGETAADVHKELLRANHLIEDQLSSLQAARNYLAQVSSSGLSWNSWETARALVSPLFPADGSCDDQAAVAGALQQQRANVEGLQQKRIDTLQLLEGVRLDLAQLVSNVLLHSSGTRDTLLALQRLQRQAEGAVQAIQAAAAQWTLDGEESLELVLERVEAAMLAFDKVLHARTRDEEGKKNLAEKENELSLATQRLSRGERARGNLERANGVFSRIVGEHSLEQATADAFRSIKAKVSTVFSQIHSPPEYELGSFDDEGGLLIRRDDAMQHAVDQVSTGQRAALALSIFLASNESAANAPPVLLIDDPVAHIDDLNALSFLDYLREIALKSRRQIFFATADVRLAALFQRKFEFLGGERFKRISLA